MMAQILIFTPRQIHLNILTQLVLLLVEDFVSVAQHWDIEFTDGTKHIGHWRQHLNYDSLMLNQSD